MSVERPTSIWNERLVTTDRACPWTPGSAGTFRAAASCYGSPASTGPPGHQVNEPGKPRQVIGTAVRTDPPRCPGTRGPSPGAAVRVRPRPVRNLRCTASRTRLPPCGWPTVPAAKGRAGSGHGRCAHHHGRAVRGVRPGARAAAVRRCPGRHARPPRRSHRARAARPLTPGSLLGAEYGAGPRSGRPQAAYRSKVELRRSPATTSSRGSTASMAWCRRCTCGEGSTPSSSISRLRSCR